MTFQRLMSAGRALLLTGVGLLASAGTLPRLSINGGLPRCLTESPSGAWLGLHLQLLTASGDCPQGQYAAGPHYAEVAHLWVALSLSTVLVGLVTLLGTLGAGVWARKALRAARHWVAHQIQLVTAWCAIVVPPRRVPVPVVIVHERDAAVRRQQLRRGPPSPFH